MTTPHTTRTHARLPPSSAHRWRKCPGSIRLSAGLPDTASAFAAEGTAAHMLAERCLQDGSDAVRFKGFGIDTESNHQLGPIDKRHKHNGTTAFAVDAEMIEGVQLYLDTVREVADSADDFESEQRMDMTGLVPGVFGTADASAYRESDRRVTVIDFKYGKGIAVEVEDNAQLLTYALGVAQRYHNRGVEQVELIVVQPRAPHRGGPVRRWVTDIIGLYEHAADLQRAAAEADRPDAPLLPGAWCKFCKAAAVCPALEDRALADHCSGRDVLGNLTMDDPATYDRDRLARALADLPLVMGWCKAVEQFAHAAALRGEMPPGFKLVAKRATRQWRDQDAAVEALRTLYTLSDDDIYETALRSPAQVEPLVPGKNKAERAKAIEWLTAKQSSGVALAPVDDPRDAVDPNDARGFEAVQIAERE